MALIKPFKGLRPNKEVAVRLAAPPYDVLSSEEAREMAKANPVSFLHVSKPEIDLDPSIDLYDDRVYAKATENFRRFINEGVLVPDKEEHIYVYRQKMGDHVQTGFVAGASVEDYEKNIIKKHELTRDDKEIDRTRHIVTLNAQTGPVFLAYRGREDLDSILVSESKKAPEYDLTTPDGVVHTFWVIKDKAVQEKVVSLFASVPFLYVADGHHRSAAATRVKKERAAANPHHTGKEEYNYFLSVIFPHDQLQIMAYNRVVKDLNGLSREDFLKRVQEKYTVTPVERKSPVSVHELCIYLPGQWYSLQPKAGIFDASDAVESLDAQILQKNLIAPILGIENIRKDKRIDFVGGIRGVDYLQSLVDKGEFALAFSFRPTTMDELLRVADAGQIMPPKSTWFEPKLRSGLVIHQIED